MQTLRSILSILLIVLFIPSPAVLANSVSASAAARMRSAAANSGGGAGSGGTGGGGSTSAGAHAAAEAQAVHRRSQMSMAAIKRMQEAARLHSGAIADPNRPGQFLPDVPNGHVAGGLQEADGIDLDPSLWQGAKRPVSSEQGGKSIVTVEQETAQALLTWKSFNVGKDTILNFDQSAGGADKGNWAAFNWVAGGGVSPSQILGQIKADGQVYVINPNGIIFGSNSQVDVRALTVSSLPVNRNLVEGGVLNNENVEFLFSGLMPNQAQNDALGFTPEPPPADIGRYGDVLVMAGAQLRSSRSEDGNGGRIMLVGPNVRNHGTISTPGGQTILAAGLQVGVAAHDSNDASLRGLDVYVGAVDANSGHALNAGLIEVMQGNAMMVGRTVEVTGGIDSSTSVALNGRIDLIAAYGAEANKGNTESGRYVPFLNQHSGTVLVGADSVLRILPELQSEERVAASELLLRSQMNISGRDIYFGERSTIVIPSGVVDVNAGVWKEMEQVGGSRVFELINAGGQIYMDRDSLISVAGTTDVRIPLSQVLLSVELRGAELADSPVQRDDILRGKTITVDIRKKGTLNGVDWVGSPLADVSGYLGLIERTVAELTMAGGEVNFNAGGAVVMQEGSKIDVSGGFARYEAGTVRTTALIKDGRKINIADALPDVKYDSVYQDTITVDSPRWGQGDSYSKHLSQGGSSYENAYTEGAAGGSISMTASAMALDGSLRGSTVVGERQRTHLPEHASLSLAFQSRDLNFPRDKVYPVISPNAPTVTFANDAPAAAAAGAFTAGQGAAVVPQERQEGVVISADMLGKDGFGNLSVSNRAGDVVIGSGVNLVGQTGGSLVLEGANVTVDGSVRIAGGTIDLSAYNVSYDKINSLTHLGDNVNPSAEEGRGVISIGEGALLSTAGEVISDRLEDVGTVQDTYAVNGGKISLRGFQTHLAERSVVDVSGGVHHGLDGSLRYGNGGAIILEGGRDPMIHSMLPGVDSEGNAIKGVLEINGTLKGFAGGRGGSLSLLAPVVEIGTVGVHADALVLDSGFFSQGGFSDFNIRGIGAADPNGVYNEFVSGVMIGSDAVIRPEVTSLIAEFDDGVLTQREIVYEESVRAPGSLTFGAVGAVDTYGEQLLVRGEVTMQEGARIETDAGGSVAFEANAVSLHGTVVTPGGSITVKGGSSYDSMDSSADRALATVFIGESAQLLAQGKVVHTYDAQGLKPGKAYAGGTITLQGNIVTEAGAELNVSGGSGFLDVPNSYNPVSSGLYGTGAGRGHTRVAVDTSGGTIRLAGSQMLVSEATLVGKAGGADAAGAANATGGTLEVSSGRYYKINETLQTTADVNLSVIQSGNLMNDPAAGMERGTGRGVTGADGSEIAGGGHFAMDTFTQGGFDNLTLGGNVGFAEAVDINARGTVHIAKGGVLQIASDGSGSNAGQHGAVPVQVNVNAGHVTIGQNFRNPVDPAVAHVPFFTKTDSNQSVPPEHTFMPEMGEGILRVQAGSIDIGTLVLHGINDAEFAAAPNGSIRGNGTLNMAGKLVLEGGQVHPTTATQFNITAYDYSRNGENITGSITFGGGNKNLALPYSAGGTLNAYASEIRQEGVLRSPFGVINLGWDGTGSAPVNAVSGVAVPVASNVTLADGSVTSVSGVGPDGKGIKLPYGLLLNGVSWIDPRGVDITLGGLPEKKVSISGKDIVTEDGSLIDMRGGGDLFAYRWVPGVGGSRDVLTLPGSFAVIPGYNGIAPSAPYNTNPSESTLGSDKGYTDASLKIGDQVYLSGHSGLEPGYYTLLPARYALLEGAYLVTPKGGTQIGNDASLRLADGSHLVSGYRVDGVSGTAVNGKALSMFEVAGRDVVMRRSQYEIYSANEFLAAAAADRDLTTPRLPADSGQLVFTASERMQLEGALHADAAGNGRGSLVDINSTLDIVIGADAANGGGNVLHLDAQTLNDFAAASLLIGGVRSIEDGDIVVRTSSANVTLDNAGSALAGTDIILVGKDSVRLAEGAELVGIAPQKNGSASAGTIRIGDTEQAGSGDGALVRASGDKGAMIERVSVSGNSSAGLVVGEGAQISGGSVTLDSSSQTLIDPQAQLHADTLNLGSGRISLVLDEAATVRPDGGLVLSGAALDSILGSVESLGLSSYLSVDVYGGGSVGSGDVESLAINTPVIRAFETNGGEVSFVASNLLLQNTTGKTETTGVLPADGSVEFRADTLRLGKGVIGVDGFGSTQLTANNAVSLEQDGGLNAANDLRVVAPLIVAATGADYALRAGGDFAYERAAAANKQANTDLGAGASLSIEGESVTLGSDIVLPAGKLDVRARSGDVTLLAAEGMRIDMSGSRRTVYDRETTTDAGEAKFRADLGNVTIGEGTVVDVSATGSGAKAGKVNISAAQGALALHGALKGGNSGDAAFNLDALGLVDAQGNTTNSVAALDAALNEGDFSGSRNYRLRSGDVVVDGVAKARSYSVSADAGSITVSGLVDASGDTGGNIELRAANDVVLEDGGVLSVAAKDFNTAGKGGKVFLEAGSQVNGQMNRDARVGIREGSLIDLSVASKTAQSIGRGLHSGVLHLRAAQNTTTSDLGIDTIEGEIRDASHIIAEGYRIYNLAGTGGVINDAVKNAMRANGNTFLGAAGTTTSQYRAMLDRLSGGNIALAEQIILQAGAELINLNGDITLGNATPGTSTAWDLSTYRFGARSSAGVLTLRASGNIGIYDAISDGFSGDGTRMWLAQLMTPNANLPTNAQSWSYRMVAGADHSAADYRQVLGADALAADKGSLLLGRNAQDAAGSTSPSNPDIKTDAVIGNRFFQVIRTGSGDIDVASARDIRFLNQFASIYTAGTRIASPTVSAESANHYFELPREVPVNISGNALYTIAGNLGGRQQMYGAQYSFSGGDVSLQAGGDIGRYTRLTNNGELVLDSSRQMPTNWLYRRGVVDSNGNYGSILLADTGLGRFSDPAASTTWWVDFSNFFQSVGALGGGNVSLVAGRDIINVDGVVPTNARAFIRRADASGGSAQAGNRAEFVELGGGDLRVQAGRNIDGGVYYVERGQGSLSAGGVVTTNQARSIDRGFVGRTGSQIPAALPSESWMPTTLFLGKGGFDVSATGDVLLGPVANVFLMPQGFLNGYWYKTYFSTYAADSAVSVRSVAGDVTLRNQVTMPDKGTMVPFLSAWFARQNLLDGDTNASFYQPWLRLAESSVEPFATLFTVQPPTLRLDSHSADVNISGSYNLAPSATGTLEVLAAGNIHALSMTGVSMPAGGQRLNRWSTSMINLSDSNPNFLPGATNPLSYTRQSEVGTALDKNAITNQTFLFGVNRLFEETGQTDSGLQIKQALHAAGLLHRNDPDPVYLYAGGGDISGLTLYSAKPARIIASRDITDIAFYLQNLSKEQVSLVAAGRDIVAYNNSSERRLLARSEGNAFNVASSEVPTALGGDIQLGGPGTLQILAGRNLDLGVGPRGRNGLSAGVTTIGNRRNPYLPETGAEIIAGAGIGAAMGLAESDLDFPAFIDAFLNPDTSGALGERYLKVLGDLMRNAINDVVWADFIGLDADAQEALALQVYLRAKARGDIDASAPDRPADISAFVRDFLNPATGGQMALRYLSELQGLMQIPDAALAWEIFNSLDAKAQAPLALNIFYTVLRDAGRDYNNPAAATFGRYDNGYAAIKALFPENTQTLPGNTENGAGGSSGEDGEDKPSRWAGNIALTSRQFKTAAGGDISLFAPGGGIVVGFPVENNASDQGILTEAGGDIRVFTHDSVEVGSSRIFTLRGGDIAIWSSTGDIAAGSAARTVRSAPPNRVVIDTQTGAVLTDLSGLATGGGIGALQTVKGAAASDIDLIAPEGSVDAGDAGIRVSGNVNVAAVEVINAGNISSAGNSAGVPSTAVALPNVGSLNAASSAAQAATSTMGNAMGSGSRESMGQSAVPSVISIEVLGYGEEEDERRAQSAPLNPQQSAPLNPQAKAQALVPLI